MGLYEGAGLRRFYKCDFQVHWDTDIGIKN